MSKKVYLYPFPGHRVKDPDTLAVLPENGGIVKLSSYYRRRIKDGSAFIGESGAAPDEIVAERKRLSPQKPKTIKAARTKTAPVEE